MTQPDHDRTRPQATVPKWPDDDRRDWRRQESITPLPGGIDFPDDAEPLPGKPDFPDEAEDGDQPQRQE